MFIYNYRPTDSSAPSPWVVGTRFVALIVTAALAWPLLDTVPSLRFSLGIYTAATLTVLVLQLMESRWSLTFLGGFMRAGQFACELAVVSQIVLNTGGLRSPSIFLYLMTIISAAVSYRLVGTLLVASAASISYTAIIWLAEGHSSLPLRPGDWFGTVHQLSDEDFFAVFARICIFLLCAFIGGYLAQRLWSKDRVLARTTQALEVAKLETGDILKHLQSGILTVDLAGRIVFFNRAAETILGIPGRGVRGRTLRDVFGAQYPELVERLETVLTSRKMDVRTELSLHRPDGHSVPIGISTSVLGGSGKQPRGLISIFQDLTQPKLIEEKMRVQDRLAAIGQLSAAIAHEIRNPLAAISGSVEVLRNELAVEGENKKLLELIITESGRLNKILTDFLMYARIRPTISGRVCVAPVLNEVFEIARRRYDGARGLNLFSSQTDASLAVKTDADHLKQMLINLVFNAIEALGHEGGQVVVEVGLPNDSVSDHLPLLETPPEWVEIAVKDNGCGIPDEIRSRLFEPFVSSKSTGTGLGLAIVARLAEHAGGQVCVDSTPGAGTTFTLLLPRFVTARAEGALENVPFGHTEMGLRPAVFPPL